MALHLALSWTAACYLEHSCAASAEEIRPKSAVELAPGSPPSVHPGPLFSFNPGNRFPNLHGALVCLPSVESVYTHTHLRPSPHTCPGASFPSAAHLGHPRPPARTHRYLLPHSDSPPPESTFPIFLPRQTCGAGLDAGIVTGWVARFKSSCYASLFLPNAFERKTIQEKKKKRRP